MRSHVLANSGSLFELARSQVRAFMMSVLQTVMYSRSGSRALPGVWYTPGAGLSYLFVHFREGLNYGDQISKWSLWGAQLFMHIWFSGGYTAKEDGRELACFDFLTLNAGALNRLCRRGPYSSPRLLQSRLSPAGALL